MLFEFQHELENGEWEALGLSRSGGDSFDIDAGVSALEATWEGALPSGSYRVRSPEGDSRWRYATVDRVGTFRLVDE
jgi:hypothetical protein